jgi:hypothetical protein
MSAVNDAEAEGTSDVKSTLYPKITGKIEDIKYHISKHVEQHPGNGPFPFTGTVKLHGTHADLVVHKDERVICQSRNRTVLTQVSPDSQTPTSPLAD